MKRERVNIPTIIYHLPMTSPVAHGNPMIKTTTKKTSFNPAFLMPCQDTWLKYQNQQESTKHSSQLCEDP